MTNMPSNTTSADNIMVVDLKSCIDSFFVCQKSQMNTGLPVAMSYYRVNDSLKTLDIYVKEGFASQVFTPAKISSVYSSIRTFLPQPYSDYDIRIYGHDTEISMLVPNLYAEEKDLGRMWQGRD